MKKVIIGLIFSGILALKAHIPSFQEQWSRMQHAYISLIQSLTAQNLLESKSNYCHTYWAEQKELLKNTILGTPDPACWSQNPIRGTMVCSGFCDYQQYELDYLHSCISERTAHRIFKYQDTHFPRIDFECKELNCSSNTLVHLYYAAHILERAEEFKHVVEFGGGYGNLARILKTILPDSTIVIIDLPELLALQHLFLSTTLENPVIHMHATVPQSYEPRAIHLIPIQLIDQLHLSTDVFVSTFALSETPSLVQQKIVEKKFFNAETLFITGQIDGWHPYINFETQHLVQKSIRSLYKNTQINLFHYSFHNHLKSYEIIASH